MPKSKRDRRDGISVYKGKFRISYIDGTGRRRQETIDATTVQLARQVRSKRLEDAERQRMLGIVPETEKTLAQIIPEYLRYQKARLVPKGYERCSGIVEKHLQPAFGAKPVASIQRGDIEQYVTDRRMLVSAATVTKELNTTKHLLSWAVGRKYIRANPAQKLRASDRPIAGRLRYLQHTEMPGLLAYCSSWMQPIVLLLVATGMRRGELLALRWLDVYRAENKILLPQSKNGKGRIVWLNRLACEVIDRLPRSKDAQAEDHVFSEKEYLSPENLSLNFHRACRRAKISDFRLHDLRHTCASWMAMRGADIHTIAAQLGHDVKMAARYAHLAPAHLQQAVGQLDSLFPPTLAIPALPAASADTEGIPIRA
jgi:integrase